MDEESTVFNTREANQTSWNACYEKMLPAMTTKNFNVGSEKNGDDVRISTMSNQS